MKIKEFLRLPLGALLRCEGHTYRIIGRDSNARTLRAVGVSRRKRHIDPNCTTFISSAERRDRET